MTELTSLVNQITRAQNAFHAQQPIMEDNEYERLRARLKELSPNHPALTRVGAPYPAAKHRKKMRRSFIMGSLPSLMTKEEFLAWARENPGPYIVQYKYDGAGLELIYRNGELELALSRGDGWEGQDISATAIRFRSLPVQLDKPVNIVVRGEALLSNEDWLQMDPDQSSNPRNKVAGICNSTDGEFAELVDFVAFDLYDRNGVSLCHQEDDTLVSLARVGFSPAPLFRASTVADVLRLHEELGKKRSANRYWLDGLVIRQLQRRDHPTEKYPPGRCAFKWPPEELETILQNIRWQIGDKGKVTPVGDLEPVRCAGAMVARATLCNPSEIARLKIRIGDKVRVCRRGEAIPKITSLVTAMPGRKTIFVPEQLNGYQVARRRTVNGGETADIFVDMNHPTVQQGVIAHWVKEHKILGLGPEYIAGLFNQGMVTSLPDLYRLEVKTLAEVAINNIRIGAARAASLMAEIDKTRTLPLARFIGTMPVTQLGVERVQALIERSRRLPGHVALDKVSRWFTGDDGFSILLTHAKELGVPGLAGIWQPELDAISDMVQELHQLITVVMPKPVQVQGGHAFQGCSFCFTRVRPTEQEKEKLQRYGAEIKSGVSAKLTYLVQADEAPTEKSRKAQELNVKVLSYAQFQAQLG